MKRPKRTAPMTSQQWERVVIQEIKDFGEGLTSWETDFVESIEDQVSQGRHRSNKQLEILDQIHSRRCGR